MQDGMQDTKPGPHHRSALMDQALHRICCAIENELVNLPDGSAERAACEQAVARLRSRVPRGPRLLRTL